MNNVQSANIIKDLCKKKNIAISVLLSDCDIRKGLIYDMEKRDKTPSPEILEKIANYLDCSVECLLGQEEESERATGFLPERLQEAMGDMSCEDFAKKFDGNANVISLYLQGQRKPSKVTLHLMAIYLGVNPEWLYGLDVPKHKKLAPTDGDELTEDKKYLIGAVRSMSDDDVRKLRLIVEEVILSRGQ